MSSETDLRLAVHGLDVLSKRIQEEIIWILRVQFGPIVEEAGMHLRLIPANHSSGDLNIDLDSKAPPGRICGTTLLGEDGGGRIWVRSHRELRVCGRTNPATGKPDTRRFLTTDLLLARALANTIMHELGHFIANLKHSSDIGNYMMTGELPKDQQTLSSQRKTFAGHQSFTANQRAALVTQLHKREWIGDPISFH
jgi:hypothetical protein